MATVHVPGPQAQRAARSWPGWLESSQLWAGVSIVAIWLAVLFVGLFGPSIVGNDGTSVPSVIVVAICAAIATRPVARWSFARRPDDRSSVGSSSPMAARGGAPMPAPRRRRTPAA